jgi:hypothetical protein
MSAHSFPFQAQQPVVTLTLLPPDPTLPQPPTRRTTCLADTGFSDYLQLDGDTFLALHLQNYLIGTLTSELVASS